MMKKIAAFAGAGAMFLATATPAFAFRFSMPSYDLTNYAHVDTDVTAKADTGDNTQKVYGTGSNFLDSGNAVAAAKALTLVNTNASDCGCTQRGDVYNRAHVDTDVTAKADTGDNYQKVYGGFVMPTFGRYNHHQQQPAAENVMFTGDAVAGAEAWTVVNTTLAGFSL